MITKYWKTVRELARVLTTRLEFYTARPCCHGLQVLCGTEDVSRLPCRHGRRPRGSRETKTLFFGERRSLSFYNGVMNDFFDVWKHIST